MQSHNEMNVFTANKRERARKTLTYCWNSWFFSRWLHNQQMVLTKMSGLNLKEMLINKTTFHLSISVLNIKVCIWIGERTGFSLSNILGRRFAYSSFFGVSSHNSNESFHAKPIHCIIERTNKWTATVTVCIFAHMSYSNAYIQGHCDFSVRPFLITLNN